MKRILIAFFLISNIFAFCQDNSQQISKDQKENRLNLLEISIANQGIIIDSLKLQIRQETEINERANRLYTLSEEIYSKSKDSLGTTYWLISLFLGIIALLATIIGWNVIQSRREIRKSSETLKNDAEQKIVQLTESNEEQIREATEKLVADNQSRIAELASNNEQLLSHETELLKNFSTQKIAEITQSNEELIVRMVSKHVKEQYLLQNSKILIINKTDTNRDNGLEMILNKFKSNVRFLDTLDFEDINLNELNNYDAVILDNINYEDDTKNWNFKLQFREKLIAIVKRTCDNKSAFLYFGDNKKDGEFSFDPELKEVTYLINFANKPATLFANLIDLLDFRQLITSI